MPPEFFIGAHVAGAGPMMRDGQRYRSYFPALKQIAPEKRFALANPASIRRRSSRPSVTYVWPSADRSMLHRRAKPHQSRRLRFIVLGLRALAGSP
ncbi:MAG: hypothetical protein DLM68_17040 [Hyphomicrobiales bacterium]|nr:MAG: hypothetical protein DLM68_17040 [Hyphomicrobiales bacterium]